MSNESTPLDPGARWERGARIFALVAIPIVMAAGGWVIQSRLATHQLQREYVAIAISVLTDPDVVYPSLHFWAVDVLAQNSPTPMADSLVSELKQGVVTLSVRPASPLGSGDTLAQTSESQHVRWFTVLGTFGVTQLARARTRARDLSDQISITGELLGAVQSIRIYRTPITSSYALTLGGPLDRSTALQYATTIREHGWVPDAYARADRGWVLVDSLVP